MSVKLAQNETFEEEIQSETLTVVDFYADWCGPCRALGPVIEDIAKERQDVSILKVDIDKLGDLAGKHGISSIPTVIFFKKGKELERFVGAKPKDSINALIDRLR